MRARGAHHISAAVQVVDDPGARLRVRGASAGHPFTADLAPPRKVSLTNSTCVPDGGGLSRSMVRFSPGRVRWIICAVTRGMAPARGEHYRPGDPREVGVHGARSARTVGVDAEVSEWFLVIGGRDGRPPARG